MEDLPGKREGWGPSYIPFLLAVLLALAGLPVAQVAPSAIQHAERSSSPPQGAAAQDLGVMRPDHETRLEWIREYNAAPRATYDVRVATVEYPTSFSLLNHIQYAPSERNQGSCDNCWAWAGTGVLETALDVQGVKGISLWSQEGFLNP